MFVPGLDGLTGVTFRLLRTSLSLACFSGDIGLPDSFEGDLWARSNSSEATVFCGELRASRLMSP